MRDGCPAGFFFLNGIAWPDSEMSFPKWNPSVLSARIGAEFNGRSAGRGSSFLLWGEPGFRWFWVVWLFSAGCTGYDSLSERMLGRRPLAKAGWGSRR
jgi:hypothetical protein